MPRLIRLNRPGRFYHVISRFVDRRWFLDGEAEREMFLRMFAHAMAGTDWRCLAYAIMSNHLHFAMIAGQLAMASWTVSAFGGFASWWNAQHNGLGPVFADRPKDYEVLPADQADVIAYIHNNPVRAGVVALARDSDWTSHRAFIGLERAPSWLHVDEALERCGFEHSSEFDEFVTREHASPRKPGLDLGRMARAARRRGGVKLATPEGEVVPIVGREFARIRPDPRGVLHVVAEAIGIEVEALASRRRVPELVRARRLVVHLGKVMGLCGSEIAMALGISEQAVSKMYRQSIERAAWAQVLRLRDVLVARLS